MSADRPKLPKKGAGKRLRELYTKNRENSKASEKLLAIMKDLKADQY